MNKNAQLPNVSTFKKKGLSVYNLYWFIFLNSEKKSELRYANVHFWEQNLIGEFLSYNSDYFS